MTTSDEKVRKALIQAVKDYLTANETISTTVGDFTGLPTIADFAIGWENIEFDPAGKDFWAGVYYVPNSPQGRGIGFTGRDEQTGFVQVDLNSPPDTGEGVIEDWYRKARIYFHTGRIFTYDGQGVEIMECGISAGRHVENHYRKSLTIVFRADFKRYKVV